MIHQWLDLERAQVLNSMIRAQAAIARPLHNSNVKDSQSAQQTEGERWISTFEEYELIFLVRTSVKSLKDVACLLASKTRELSEA
jgi:hypothetical protein